MKKCPVCGSVNMDQEYSCGVCGSDLTAATTLNEESLDQPATGSETTDRRKVNRTPLLLVLVGPVLSILGLVLVLNLLNFGSDLIALAGIPILILGLLATMGTIGSGPSFRTWLRYRTWAGKFRGKYGSYDPRPREVEAEERQSSLEEQDEDYGTREERKKEGFD